MPKKHATKLDLDFVDVVQTGHSALRDAIDNQAQTLREEICGKHAELAMALYTTRDMLEKQLGVVQHLQIRIHEMVGMVLEGDAHRPVRPTVPTGGGDLDDEIPF